MQPACNYLVSPSQHWTVLSSDSIIAGYVVEINTRSLNWIQFGAHLMKRDIFKIQYLNPIPLTFSGADRVAQLVERRTNKPKVVGSNQVVVKQLFCLPGMASFTRTTTFIIINYPSVLIKYRISTTYIYLYIYIYIYTYIFVCVCVYTSTV